MRLLLFPLLLLSALFGPESAPASGMLVAMKNGKVDDGVLWRGSTGVTIAAGEVKELDL